MRLALLTTLTMVAFAANSLLNRLAVDSGAIDPMSFALVRVLSGAAILLLLVTVRQRPLPLLARGRALGALSLSAYLIGFSLAYQTLDAGLGALILFGVVQVSMFAWSARKGMMPAARRLAGAGLAFLGLVLLLWPGGSAGPDLLGAGLMVLAGIGWAAYTLAGRSAPDALAATAANFLLSVPIVALGLWLAGAADLRLDGVALAIVSGAVTSGLGYALWYTVLPRLDANVAAVVQLSVPVIALVAGTLLLGESLGARVLIAAAIVLGGIALALTAPAAPGGRSRSRD